MQVTFLTVGEYPTATGLHASQVLPFAAYLSSQGVSVHWIAFVPLEMRLRDLLVKGGALLTDIRKLAAQHGVEFTVSLFPITIVRAYPYIFRHLLVPLAGSRLENKLKRLSDSGGPHIIHCRSYFATDVALEVKKKNKNILVSFDMRSLLPPEIPLMFPAIGPWLYGGLKCWETFLLNKVDFSFLPSQRGIRLLEFEGMECSLIHINIAGFEGPLSSNQLNISSTQKVIGYIGGFGPWHSITVLEKVFKELSKHVSDCSFDVVTSEAVTFDSQVKVRSLPHQEVMHAISGMLAVVVPGIEVIDGHYNKLVSSYLFSTKAAEALSLGVPLIVNAQINELADYVRSNGCGLIFSIKNGQPRFEGINHVQLNDIDIWINMRKAACKCAPEFMRNNVFAKYLHAWEGKFSTKDTEY